MTDFQGAIRHAHARLQAELPATLTYHNLWHTRDEVGPASVWLARSLGVAEAQVQLVEVAAAYHDLGFIESPVEHERTGARLAAEALAAFGFGAAQIEQIEGMILATRLPQTPHNLLEEIVADADLDVLGRADFLSRNEALRQEFLALGRPAALPEWRRQQLGFLRQHRYFTPAARARRDAGKQLNLADLEDLLRQET